MNILSRFGVTVETLDKFQDPAACSGRVLLLDGDYAYNFLKELNLSPVNLDFLEDCYNQDWRRDEYHEPEE